MNSSHSPRNFSEFIGVHLGGGRGKNTAVALLCCASQSKHVGQRNSGNGVVVTYVGVKDPSGRPFYDDILLSFVREHVNNAVVAIDAPLRPPVCLRCRLDNCPGLERCIDPVVRWFKDKGNDLAKPFRNKQKPLTTPYTQRACEVILYKKDGIFPREALGQGMGPLAARAHYLCRALKENFQIDKNLIEVSPKATIHKLCGSARANQYKKEVSTWRTRAEILEMLSKDLTFEIWREGCLKNDHFFEAVICAYTAYLWSTQGWTLPETDRDVYKQDGWIWFPPGEEYPQT